MCLLVEAHPLMCLHIISSIGEKKKPVAAGQECHKDDSCLPCARPRMSPPLASPETPLARQELAIISTAANRETGLAGGGLGAKEAAHSVMSVHDGQKSECWLPLPWYGLSSPPPQLLQNSISQMAVRERTLDRKQGSRDVSTVEKKTDREHVLVGQKRVREDNESLVHSGDSLECKMAPVIQNGICKLLVLGKEFFFCCLSTDLGFQSGPSAFAHGKRSRELSFCLPNAFFKHNSFSGGKGKLSNRKKEVTGRKPGHGLQEPAPSPLFVPLERKCQR